MEIIEKRSEVVMFSFVVYDFSNCAGDTLKLLKAVDRSTRVEFP